MKLKEQGFVIDTSSERALKKKRLGIKLNTFSLEENKGKFVQDSGKEEEKDKKGVKKGEKKKGKVQKGGEGEELVEDTREGFSREMETYKTVRQNSLYSSWNRTFKSYKKRYD